MKVGIFLPLVGSVASPDYLAAAARAAEASGLDSLWVGEHVALFDSPASRYPYSDDGTLPMTPDQGVLDPFAALAYAAALTSRIRLGTGICLVPQRQPLYTARLVADIDVLSQGRFEFGVGVGWLREEFEALGIPFTDRGRRCRDYVRAMQCLWCDEISQHKGPFVNFPPLRFNPKPVQKPHPPITFGGESDAALRRVADLGQGWFGFNRTPDEVGEALVRLDRFLEARGRQRSDVSIKVSPYLKGVDPDGIRRYHENGVDEVITLAYAPGPAEIDEAIRRTGGALAPVAAELRRNL